MSSTPATQTPQTSGNRPPQPNLLHNPDDVSESDEEQPPPYSRYDPLTTPPQNAPPQDRPPRPTPPEQPPRSQHHHGSPQSSPVPPNTRFHSPPRPAQSPFQRPGSSFPQQAPNPQHAPFQYPPGYFCMKCHNTGFKYYNGSPCGTCARLFGRQTANVQIIPDGYHAVPPPNALVVPAGDPRLGGVLCGNCKGTGRVVLLFFDENCPVCRGIGRIR